MYIWGIEPKRTWYLPPKPREKWLPWTEISAAAKGLTDIIMARKPPNTPACMCVCGGGALLWSYFRNEATEAGEVQ